MLNLAACIPPVQRIVNRRLQTREDREDAIQEALFSIWKYNCTEPRHINRLANCAAIRVYRKNKYYNLMRSSYKTFDADTGGYGEGNLEEGLQFPQAAQIRDNHERFEASYRNRYVKEIWKVIPFLSKYQQAAIALLMAGCSHREMAWITGRPLETIKTNIKDARKRIRSRLAYYDNGEPIEEENRPQVRIKTDGRLAREIREDRGKRETASSVATRRMAASLQHINEPGSASEQADRMAKQRDYDERLRDYDSPRLEHKRAQYRARRDRKREDQSDLGRHGEDRARRIRAREAKRSSGSSR